MDTESALGFGLKRGESARHMLPETTTVKVVVWVARLVGGKLRSGPGRKGAGSMFCIQAAEVMIASGLCEAKGGRGGRCCLLSVKDVYGASIMTL